MARLTTSPTPLLCRLVHAIGRGRACRAFCWTRRTFAAVDLLPGALSRPAHRMLSRPARQFSSYLDLCFMKRKTGTICGCAVEQAFQRARVRQNPLGSRKDMSTNVGQPPKGKTNGTGKRGVCVCVCVSEFFTGYRQGATTGTTECLSVALFHQNGDVRLPIRKKNV